MGRKPQCGTNAGAGEKREGGIRRLWWRRAGCDGGVGAGREDRSEDQRGAQGPSAVVGHGASSGWAYRGRRNEPSDPGGVCGGGAARLRPKRRERAIGGNCRIVPIGAGRVRGARAASCGDETTRQFVAGTKPISRGRASSRAALPFPLWLFPSRGWPSALP